MKSKGHEDIYPFQATGFAFEGKRESISGMKWYQYYERVTWIITNSELIIIYFLFIKNWHLIQMSYLYISFHWESKHVLLTLKQHSNTQTQILSSLPF